MKNQELFAISLILGFSIILNLFPFNAVHAAKFQSGVTIKATPKTPTNETAPTTNEICSNGIDDNGNGAIDEVTCLPPSTSTTTEKICNDLIDNDNDGKIDMNDQDCASTTSQPAPEMCTNGVDDNANGIVDDPEECTAPAGTAGQTCGLQIVSGAPINYGQLTPGQPSTEKQVMIKNTGNSPTPAAFTIKGDSWINDVTAATISGPEVTHAAINPGDYNNKASLSTIGEQLGQMAGGQTKTVYFQFLAWANAPSGSFHQDVTIDLLC